MRTSPSLFQQRRAWWLCVTVAGCSLFAACALKDNAVDAATSGVVVNVTDSSNVVLNLDDNAKTVFMDSGSFNLDDIRQKMSDRGLNPDSIQITGIVVTYDDATKAFLTANKGVGFYLKLYLRENDGEKKLALETLPKDIGDFKTLAFDPEMVTFELGKDIFANPDGFPDLLASIKNKSVHSAWIIAELNIPGKLKTTGSLKLNMVVTVAGKV